ncbi:MAG: hypothetical protein K6G61_05135 [Solobacterium sp.]|nr:hypothetical protein [Solobacterium sp.]
MNYILFMLTAVLLPCYPHYRGSLRFTPWRLLYLWVCTMLFIALKALLYPVLFRKVILVLSPLLFSSFADIRGREIPDLTYLPVCVYLLLHAHYIYLTESLILFFLLLLPAWKRMIGFGDIKVFLALTLLTGQMICFVLMCASGLCLLVHSKKGSGRQIPFLPYTAAGYALYLLFF